MSVEATFFPGCRDTWECFWHLQVLCAHHCTTGGCGTPPTASFLPSHTHILTILLRTHLPHSLVTLTILASHVIALSNALSYSLSPHSLSPSLSPHSLSPSLLPHSLSPPPSLSLGFRLKGRDVHSAGIATHFVAKDKVSVQLSIATTTTCSPSLVQSVSNLHLEDNDVLRVLLDSSHCVQLPALEDALDSLHHPHLDTVRGILDDFHKQVGLLCLSARVHACVCT